VDSAAEVQRQRAVDARDGLTAAAHLANHVTCGDTGVEILVVATDELIVQAQRQLHRRALRIVS
jgi:hypothetical protein